jgi:hypothetical protein
LIGDVKHVFVVMILAAAACGGHAAQSQSQKIEQAQTPPSVDAGSVDAAVAHAPATTDPPFAIVLSDGISPEVRARIAWELAPIARDLKTAAEASMASADAVDRLAYATIVELADDPRLLDTLLPSHARIVVYGIDLVPAVRVQLTDPRAAEAVIDRIIGRAHVQAARHGDHGWWIASARSSVAIAIVGSELVVAVGPPQSVAALWPRLEAPAPEASFIDPARIAALGHASFPDLTARCRDEVLALLGTLPRVAIHVRELSPTRIALSVDAPLPSDLLDSLRTTAGSASLRLSESAPHPIFALSSILPPASWNDRLHRVTGACEDSSSQLTLPAPWNGLRSVALAITAGHIGAQGPVGVEGFVAVDAPDPEAILEALAKLAPDQFPAGTSPRDGAAFTALPVVSFLPALSLARRADVLLLAAGAGGQRAALASLTAHGAPLLQMFVDLARITAPSDDPDASDSEASHYGFAAESGLARALTRLLGAFTLTIAPTSSGATLLIELTIPPPTKPPAPRPLTAKQLLRARCRRILRASFGAARPAYARLGLDDLDDVERTYLTSLDADQYIEKCAKLDDKARACLEGATDPIAETDHCAGNDADSFPLLEPPPIFSFFGERPLEARFHPPVDDHAARAGLAGTWRSPSETWVVTDVGDVTATRGSETERFTITIDHDGQVAKHHGDTTSMSSFLRDGDVFYGGDDGDDDVVPLVDEAHFIVPWSSGDLVVRDGAGCVVITRVGLIRPARECSFSDDAGARTLHVAYDDRQDSWQIVAGHAVAHELVESRFVRQSQR